MIDSTAPQASGRPIRFFGLLMVGWVAARLLSQSGPPLPYIAVPEFAAVVAQRLPVASPTQIHPALAKSGPLPRVQSTADIAAPASFAPARSTLTTAQPIRATNPIPVDLLDFIAFSMAFANRHYATDPDYNRGTPLLSAAPLLLSTPARPDRWQGSTWMLWRENGPSPTDTAIGRLGASQTGLRIDYDLTPDAQSRTVAYARATSALKRPTAPEAAIGLAIQPVRAIPVSLAVERRIALGQRARNANAVMAVGGFGPTPVGSGLEAEAYAQAGMVGFNRRDAFIDGKLSLLSPVNTTKLRIGAALSGGAQPGVERLDIGPELQVRLPLPSVAARISVEWRERIAGRAAPASGVAITLAADF
jgi:hypothetical protein